MENIVLILYTLGYLILITALWRAYSYITYGGESSDIQLMQCQITSKTYYSCSGKIVIHWMCKLSCNFRAFTF